VRVALTSGTLAGHEELKKVVADVIAESVTPNLRDVRERLGNLEKEVWNVLKGVGQSQGRGQGSVPDSVWSARLEALSNWDEWGRPGTGYSHLPVMMAEQLERRSSDSEDVRGRPESSVGGNEENERGEEMDEEVDEEEVKGKYGRKSER
jgi:hypothetical protein